MVILPLAWNRLNVLLFKQLTCKDPYYVGSFISRKHGQKVWNDAGTPKITLRQAIIPTKKSLHNGHLRQARPSEAFVAFGLPSSRSDP